MVREFKNMRWYAFFMVLQIHREAQDSMKGVLQWKRGVTKGVLQWKRGVTKGVLHWKRALLQKWWLRVQVSRDASRACMAYVKRSRRRDDSERARWWNEQQWACKIWARCLRLRQEDNSVQTVPSTEALCKPSTKALRKPSTEAVCKPSTEAVCKPSTCSPRYAQKLSQHAFSHVRSAFSMIFTFILGILCRSDVAKHVLFAEQWFYLIATQWYYLAVQCLRESAGICESSTAIWSYVKPCIWFEWW